MSVPIRVNSDDNISCSQPNISTSTPITNKRASPDSPDDLPATEKQEKRQVRRRNPISDLTGPQYQENYYGQSIRGAH